MKTTLIALATLTLITAASSQADRRKYVWAYGTQTIAADASELELYQTTKLAENDCWEYRIEIEHGLSPRADLAIYQIFSQKEGGSFKWDALQIRGRYRLAEAGRLPFAATAYVEYNRKIDLKEPNKAEFKLLLARDFDRVNLALNPVYEVFWAPGEAEHELGFDTGLSYELSYKWTVGIESTSRHEFIDAGDDETSSYFGPTISFASGEIYYTVGYAWGITDDSDDARVRFLMGVGL
ncbi:MAG: hypothetical protein AB1644_05580 [Candidatus Zixiibacteriota bacterium]